MLFLSLLVLMHLKPELSHFCLLLEVLFLLLRSHAGSKILGILVLLLLITLVIILGLEWLFLLLLFLVLQLAIVWLFREAPRRHGIGSVVVAAHGIVVLSIISWVRMVPVIALVPVISPVLIICRQLIEHVVERFLIE